MPIDKNTYDQIEAYLKGKLSGEEQAHFEHALKNDPELALEVKIQKASRDILQHDYAQDLSKLIEDRSNMYSQGRSYKWWVIGGATLSMLLLSYFGVQYLDQKSTNQSEAHINNDEGNNQHSSSTPSDQASKKIAGKTEEVKETSDPEKTASAEPLSSGKRSIIDTTKSINDTVIYTLNAAVDNDANASTTSSENSNEKESATKCSDKPEVTYLVDPAHRGHKDGIVTISNKSDKYLQYALIPQQETYTGNRIIDGLEPGMYQLKVRSEECEYEIAILDVPETACEKTKDFTYNTVYETDFSIPTPEQTVGKLMIVNKSGVEILNTSFDKNEAVLWDGMDKNGSPVNEGLHKIIIKTAKETCVYNVVVAK